MAEQCATSGVARGVHEAISLGLGVQCTGVGVVGVQVLAAVHGPQAQVAQRAVDVGVEQGLTPLPMRPSVARLVRADAVARGHDLPLARREPGRDDPDRARETRHLGDRMLTA
jgi:hypothetical protein